MISRLYTKLEKYFPEMKREDFYTARTGEKPENAWRLTVRWAKKKMTYDHKWMVANLPRGMCQISNAGRKAYDAMKAGGGEWKPKYGEGSGKRELPFVPFVAIGGEDLNEVADIPEKGGMHKCRCGKEHPIKTAHGKRSDGSVGNTTLQFYACGGATYLTGIDGKSIRK